MTTARKLEIAIAAFVFGLWLGVGVGKFVWL